MKLRGLRLCGKVSALFGRALRSIIEVLDPQWARHPKSPRSVQCPGAAGNRWAGQPFLKWCIPYFTIAEPLSPQATEFDEISRLDGQAADAALARLTRLATEVLGAPVAVLFLCGDQGFTRGASAGQINNWTAEFEEILSRALCRHATESDEPLLILDSFGQLLKDAPTVTRPDLASALAVRLIAEDGQVLGALIVLDAQARDWTPRETDLLSGVAASVTTELEFREKWRLAEKALRESEERYRSLFEDSRDAIYSTSSDGNFEDFNQSLLELFGYSREELIGLHAQDFYVNTEDRQRFQEEIESTGAVRDFEVQLRGKSGSVLNCLISSSVRRSGDGKVLGYQGIMHDITERKRADAENARLAAFSRENPNPILECDADGVLLHVNPAARRVAAEIGLEDIHSLLPENHPKLVDTCLQSGQGFRSVEVTVADKVFSWTYHPHLQSGAVHLFATDITGRRVMEEQLRHDALHDSLTGLPNRMLFMERLAHSILRAKRRDNYLFAVLFLDLDRFKVINDSLGHHVGDELLITVAQRLQTCLRTEDTVARFGGDEFAILLEDLVDISDATRVAERIQKELALAVNLSGFDVFTSASIGIALSSSAYERPEYLLRNADMAMYRAKASGLACFEVFDRTMHAQALTRLQLETDLRRAIEREEFRLHYQPIVSLTNGAIVGLEALIRWDHPDRGWLAPGEFVGVAEETGLIFPLGQWVLGEACRQVSHWRESLANDHLSVNVNLCAKQFSQPDLVDQIARVLEESRLKPSALKLEITESVLMVNAEMASELLERLKKIGVQIYLDDFGTGYSSLSYLHRLPLDALKIDQSFIGRMDADDQSRQLVGTIVSLASSIGLAVVGEGIETRLQLDTLREMQCDLGQGYLFAEPMAAAEIETILASHRPADFLFQAAGDAD